MSDIDTPPQVATNIKGHITQLSADSFTTDFSIKYPPMPGSGFQINSIIFIDKDFNDFHTDPEKIIERIMKHTNEFCQDSTLTTRIHIVVNKIELVDGVTFNASETIFDDSILKIHAEKYKNENIGAFILIGMSNNDNINGKVPHVGKCMDGACTGLCSENIRDRFLVVEYNDNPLSTASVISHELGHLLGMEHDFTGTDVNRRSKVSWEGDIICTNDCALMDYGLNACETLKWSRCSSEDLRKYYHVAKLTSDSKTCFEPFYRSSEKVYNSGEKIELSCDPNVCKDIQSVSWYYSSDSNSEVEWLGTTNLAFDFTDTTRKFQDTINITTNGRMVKLVVKNDELLNKGEYTCKIETERTQRFCNSNQKFTVSIQGANIIFI